MAGYSSSSRGFFSNSTPSVHAASGKDTFDLDLWWYRLIANNETPLYCMFLATNADEEVASLFENHGEELSEIAGDKCTIIYFRDLDKAKILEPFRFDEHASRVIQFIKLINVLPDRLPCVLFFEKISSGDYVYIEVKDKNIIELMGIWRELFAFVYSKKEVSLSAVKSYNLSKKVEMTKWTLNGNIRKFSTILFGELIKSLVKLQ